MPAMDGSVRVMVVDDHPDNRALFRSVVEETDGFIATEPAASGEEALFKLEDAGAADMVLMDIRMPGLGGIGAARALMQRPWHPLVILVSGDDRPDVAADPQAHGAAAFVRKEAFCPRLLKRLWALRPSVAA